MAVNYVFCGMTGADTPRALDPLILKSPESCREFFISRLSSCTDAEANRFMLHMPQGYTKGEPYEFACVSKLHNNVIDTLRRLDDWVAAGGTIHPFSLYTGGRLPGSTTWKDPEAYRVALQEVRAFPIPLRDVAVDAACLLDESELEALKWAIRDCGSDLIVEAGPLQTCKTIQTLKHVRQDKARFYGSLNKTHPQYLVVEVDDNPKLTELIELRHQGFTLMPSWDQPAAFLRTCFMLNTEPVKSS